jgi:hypothetical protein
VLFSTLADFSAAGREVYTTGFDEEDLERDGALYDRRKKMVVVCPDCDSRFEARGNIHFEPAIEGDSEGDGEGEASGEELGFLW